MRKRVKQKQRACLRLIDMETLRATGQASVAGRALLQLLDSLALPENQKESLAERILQFAKSTGKRVIHAV